MTTLKDCCDLIVGETEAHKKSEVTCPRPQSQEMMELGFGLRQSGFRVHAF